MKKHKSSFFFNLNSRYKYQISVRRRLHLTCSKPPSISIVSIAEFTDNTSSFLLHSWEITCTTLVLPLPLFPTCNTYKLNTFHLSPRDNTLKRELTRRSYSSKVRVTKDVSFSTFSLSSHTFQRPRTQKNNDNFFFLIT